jgi:hypothetical protein
MFTLISSLSRLRQTLFFEGQKRCKNDENDDVLALFGSVAGEKMIVWIKLI